MHSEQGCWAGVVAAAEVYDVNVFVFLGGAVMTESLKPTVRYGLIGIESAAVLYDLVDVERMDGLITWAGSGAGLGIHLNNDEMDAFFQRYHPLPIVNYEKVVEGIPTILTDTAQGMRELLIHMIETHGCRRIALLRGPQNHFESNERHRAYNETLAEYGFTVDSNLVCSATGWDVQQGAAMMRVMMNERGLQPKLDFDAVVGTEGQYIVSAVRELQAQGVNVPDDVLAAGYNDMSEARASAPSITVMRKSFYEAGWKSLELLVELLQDNSVADVTFIPSELIIRRSCGCWTHTVQQTGAQTPLFAQKTPLATTQSLEAMLAEHQAEIITAVTSSIGVLFPLELAKERATTLVHALFADITNIAESRHKFIAALEDALQATPANVQDMEQWHSLLSTLRHYTTPYLVDDPDRWFRVENLWQQARIVVQQEAQRRELAHNLENLLLTLMLREADRRLMDVFDMAQLLDAIAQELPKLGIPACTIALYEKPQSFTFPQVVPEWSRLILSFDELGRVNLPPEGRRFLSRNLIPDDLPFPDKAASRIVVPLYVGQQQFGFALLETGPKRGTLYTELWQLISNALQVVFLMKERLELALERERVTMLANLRAGIG
jgi:DNA-binding LacI/PurR family transcriptional regulator